MAAELHLCYESGDVVIATCNDWKIQDNYIVDSKIFDGEKQDFTRILNSYAVKQVAFDNSIIVPQINEPIGEIYRLEPQAIFLTPKGEKVIDFGQNITGFVQVNYAGGQGGKLTVRHAEVLDKEGNFYTENLRQAKVTDTYILDDKERVLLPKFTFCGFRYICIEGTPIDNCKFTAIAPSSKLKETGKIVTSNKGLNALLDNIKRSQKDNYLDVPTYCV